MREQLRAFLLMLQAEVVTPYPRETAPCERATPEAAPRPELWFAQPERTAAQLYEAASARFGQDRFASAALLAIAASSGKGQATIVRVER